MKRYLKGILIILVCGIFFSACIPARVSSFCQSAAHQIDRESGAQVLWEKRNMFVLGGAALVASPGHVFVEARDTTIHAPFGGIKLFAFDSRTGSPLWDTSIRSSSVLVVGGRALYSGEYDKVTVFDVNSGIPLELIRLPGGGNVNSLQLWNDRLYANTAGGRFHAYDMDAKTIESSGPDWIRSPILVDEQTLFLGESGEFIAVDMVTNDVVWRAGLDQGVSRGVIFTDKFILFRTGVTTAFGKLNVLDKGTGQLIWKGDIDIASNAAVVDDRIFALTTDGYLVVQELGSGLVVSRYMISPAPFVLRTAEAGFPVGAYNVSVDGQNDVALISLGDSCQLLALRVEK